MEGTPEAPRRRMPRSADDSWAPWSGSGPSRCDGAWRSCPWSVNRHRRQRAEQLGEGVRVAAGRITRPATTWSAISFLQITGEVIRPSTRSPPRLIRAARAHPRTLSQECDPDGDDDGLLQAPVGGRHIAQHLDPPLLPPCGPWPSCAPLGPSQSTGRARRRGPYPAWRHGLLRRRRAGGGGGAGRGVGGQGAAVTNSGRFPKTDFDIDTTAGTRDG
jgi:hypothetical protein